MIWVNSHSQCSHEKVNYTLSSGESKTISSITTPGKISYQCSGGALSITEKECGIDDTAAAKSTAFTSSVKSQSLGDSSAEMKFKMYIPTSSTGSSIIAAADRQCARVIDSYVIGKGNVTATPNENSSPSGSDTLYDVSCSVEIEDLRCDEGPVNSVNVIGDYNDKNGEFTLTPGYSRALSLCKKRGYSSLVDILGVTRSYPNVVDDFSMLLVCSGKSSMCSTEDKVLGEPIIQSALNCQKANVRSGLIKVPYGNLPSTSEVNDKVCSPLGFTSLETFSTPKVEDETGAFQYYTTTAVCSGYEGSQPLLDSCDGDAGSNDESSSSVTRVSCNVGNVDAVMRGSFDPATGEYSLQPSNAEIKQELCEANDYALLDNVMGSFRIGTKDYFSVQAQCSEYFGPDAQSCADDSPCYGEIVDSNSQKPKFCLGSGVCYENTCAEDPIDVEECLECGGEFSFTDSNTGSSCALTVNSIASALSEDIIFENKLVNGNANVFL